MNIFDLNTLRMAEAVLAVLNLFADKLVLAPLLPTLKLELEQMVKDARAQNNKVALPSGITELKQEKREILEKAADVLLNTLLFYAHREENRCGSKSQPLLCRYI